MADLIPFIPGDNNYTLGVALAGPNQGSPSLYLFRTRWNSRDNVDPATGESRGAWYFDLLEADETPIALGIKVVLGLPLGRTSTHKFFTEHILKAVDTSGAGIDARYDELGGRVQVLHMTIDEVFPVLEA